MELTAVEFHHSNLFGYSLSKGDDHAPKLLAVCRTKKISDATIPQTGLRCVMEILIEGYAEAVLSLRQMHEHGTSRNKMIAMTPDSHWAEKPGLLRSGAT